MTEAQWFATGVLFAALAFCAQHVAAAALRRRRARARAPRHGLFYLRPHGPQAVRKEGKA